MNLVLLVGGALFLCLVIIYLVLSALFKAYLGAGRHTETAKPLDKARGRRREGETVA